MPGFYELFESRREELRHAIDATPTPDKAASLVEAELEGLLHDFTSGGRLSPHESSVVACLIDLVKSAIRTFALASHAEVWQKDSTPLALGEGGRREPKSLFEFWATAALVETICAAIALILLWDPRTKLQFVLLAAAISVGLLRAARWIVGRVRARLRPPAEPATRKQAHMGVITVKSDIMLAHIAELLLNVDKTFTLTKGYEKDGDEPADIEPGLLEFYQDLLEARQAGDAEYAMKKLRLLPTLLERQGIQAIAFDGGNAGSFEFRPSLDPKLRDQRTLRPAFAIGKRLVRRGVVEEPRG